MLHAIWLACTGPTQDPPTSGEDSDAAADSDSAPIDSEPLVTNGVAPDEPMPLIDFSATNRDGAARSREDLTGEPTALWFYPAANTPG